MRLEISDFGGMAPLLDPTALADNFATSAKNVRLDKGVLAPSAFRLSSTGDYPDTLLLNRGVSSVAKLFDSDTRFALDHSRGAMAFASPVSPADTWGRVYYMTAAGPSFTTLDNYSPGGLVLHPLAYRLGVPAPEGAPHVEATELEEKFEEGAPDEDGNVESVLIEPDSVDVAYAYSFVDRYGHESSLSLSSGSATLAYNRTFSVTIAVNDALPTRVNFDGGKRRIYRATFDGSSSVWQYVADIPAATTSFVDTTPIGQEAEEAVSEGWLPAPNNLQNLCLVSSAFAAGYIDGYVCYSELKLPHAWPAELQYPIKYTPKGLMPLLNGLLIVTSGRPYWAEGSDPYSAIPRELPINAPCLSSESVVDMGDYAMYVSDEGLVAVGPNQAEVVTESVLDRSDMLALVDETCVAFKFENRYVFSTKDGYWLAFVPQKGLVEYAFGYSREQFNSVTFSVRDNTHYFALADGRVRYPAYQGDAADAEWHSKHFRTPPGSFSCFRVEADKYPVKVTVRCQYLNQEWQETPELEVTGPHIQRLPVMTGGLWQVAIKPAPPGIDFIIDDKTPDAGRVYRVVLGQSGQEVA